MKPKEIMEMTPREFSIVMKAENERRYDLYEMFSIHALMIRKANLTKPNKKLKTEDFFKRPSEIEKEKSKVIDMKEKIEEQERFMSQFTFQAKGGSDEKWQTKV